MWCCRHCNNNFENFSQSAKANHSRWCDSNPKRNTYKNGSLKSIEAMKIAKKNNPSLNNQYTKAKALNLPVPQNKNKGLVGIGPMLGKMHTEESKNKIRQKALASSHRRLKKNTIVYNGILLDSTWELELAKRLDNLNIKWIRPKPIKWVDSENIIHNYFADFYLEDYDLYLDPKNPHAINVQKDKLGCLLKQYNNIVILKTFEECMNYEPPNYL